MNNPNLAIALAFYHSVFNDFIVHDPSQRPCYRSSMRYIVRRITSEGITFVSKSLPDLGKACETSIISGEPIKVPKTFNCHWKSVLPSLMWEQFHVLFDDTGTPRQTETEDAVWAYFVIRQVCLAFSKAKDIPSRMTPDEAMTSFKERIVEQPAITAPSWLLNEARALIRRIVMDGDGLHPMLKQWVETPIGKHGPGAVAEKEKGLDKWNFRRIDGADLRLYRFNDRSPLPQGVAKPYSRLCVVPKDFKSLRSICIEPKEFQFAQQGIWKCLKDLLHENRLSRKAINFEHQEYSAELCKRKDLATIDLKDASDTVRLKLCRLLFPKEFFSLVTRYRSRKIAVKGDLVRPTCFASMGSALCFPIETMVFWAIARVSIHPETWAKPVRVFGDDIVVPKEDAQFVVKMLESCGFKVNHSKTCIDTPIRESCGAYTYASRDVRVVRFKASHCDDPRDWISLIESARLLNEMMLSKSAYSVALQLKQFWHVPFGHFGLPKSPEGYSCQSRWNAKLQRRELRLPRLVMRQGNEKLPGDAGLYAWYVGNSTKPSPRGTDKVKVGWVASD
jgi:hypothetical protein